MKSTKTTLSIIKLTVNMDLNIRLADNYDVPAIRDNILEVGRIVNPIVVEKLPDNIYQVLQGNRRTLAGQELFNDPKTPSGIKEGLEKVDVIVYQDLTPEERLKVVFDHGTQKSINRTELVLACWRLSRQFFSEKQIAGLMYFSLAKYTGKESKLNQVPSEPKARETYVQKWFHGTLGNYFLSALRMPDFVRDEFIKTHRAQDGILRDGETVVVKLSRERVTELSKAKTADEDNGSWDPEKGGPAFVEVWEKFVKEDAGEAEKGNGPKRPSVKDIKEKSDQYQSAVVRKALLASIGEPAQDLLELDAEAYRLGQIKKALDAAADGIKDASIKELVNLFRSGKPSDVTTWLAGK